MMIMSYRPVPGMKIARRTESDRLILRREKRLAFVERVPPECSDCEGAHSRR